MGIFRNFNTGSGVQTAGAAAFRGGSPDKKHGCETGKGIEYYEGAQCHLWPYQLSHMQVGTGASSIPGDVGEETSSVVVLGRPLTREEYGGPAQSMLLEPEDHMIYSDIDVPIKEQTIAKVGNQGIIGSGLVSVIVLDEQTANGQSINEVGLFVNNPYVFTDVSGNTTGINSASPSLLGGPGRYGQGQGGFPGPVRYFDPGNLLAAYRKFNPIKKEDYFSLLIRWSISFTEDCDAPLE